MDYKTNIISGWRSDERISGSKVYGFLMDIKNQLAKTKDKPNIQFRTDLSMYKAECDDSIPITAYVGVEELMTDPDAAYPLGEAMIPVIHLGWAVYHILGARLRVSGTFSSLRTAILPLL